MRSIYLAAILALSPFAAAAQPADRHLLGSYYRLQVSAEYVLNDLAAYENALGVTITHRRTRAGHDHSEELRNSACRLAFRWINGARATDNARSHRIVVPAALQNYHASFRALGALGRDYTSRPRDCSSLSWNDYARFINTAKTLRAEHNAVAYLAQRQSRQLAWSTTFSLELAPFPLKVEVLEGSVKLKLSNRIGPLTLDLQTGPKVQRSATRSGLTYLWIKLPDMTSRILYVEGAQLEFEVPASTISINGDTLTIECSETCLQELNAV